MQEASQRALDEFSRAKEEFAKETILRQQHEYTILQLRQQLLVVQQTNSSNEKETITAPGKEDLDRVATTRVELEKACNELRSHRTALAKEIEEMANRKQTTLTRYGNNTFSF